MVLGGVKKEEYEQVVRSNSELRVKMEKLRIENALLKDQVRALSALPQELGSLYVFIQLKINTTIDEILGNPKFAALKEKEVERRLGELMSRDFIEKTEKDGVTHYSIKTPDLPGD